MADQDKILKDVTEKEYKYGFVTDIETDIIEKGLNEDVIKIIWQKKNEPQFMLDFRLDAFRKWQKMKMPNWAYLKIPPIDFQDISYYAAPKV
jgi:Fe-S cluster assembly protein SufB